MKEFGYSLNGFSLGGIETSVWVPEFNVAFDVGRGRQELVKLGDYALTHTHMDQLDLNESCKFQMNTYNTLPPKHIPYLKSETHLEY